MKGRTQSEIALEQPLFAACRTQAVGTVACQPATSEALTVTIIDNRGELSRARERWQALARACDCRLPYLEFEWYAAALATIDGDRAPFVVFVQMNGRDVGLAPLVHTTQRHFGLPLHKFAFVNNAYTPEQGFLYLIPFGRFLGALLGSLAKRTGGAFYVDLDEMKLSPQEAVEFRRISSNGYCITGATRSESRRLLLGPTFEQTLAAADKKFRHEYARKEKRLARLGAVQFATLKTPQEIKANLDRFFGFYARSWKGAEPRPEFYYALCRAFPAEALYFAVLTLDDMPIAYLLGLRAEHSLYALKTTYDPSYYAFSPGVLLFFKTIEDAQRGGQVGLFDFGRGDEQYKRDWCPEAVIQTRITIRPRTPVHRALHWLRQHAWCPLKGSPAFRAFRRWSARLSADSAPRLKFTDATKSPTVLLQGPELDQMPMRNGLEARFAEPSDRDWLAVLTSARNLTDVQLRLTGGMCLVVQKGSRLVACFWLDDQGPEESIVLREGTLVVKSWSAHPTLASGYTVQELLKPCVTLLRRKGHRVDKVRLQGKFGP